MKESFLTGSHVYGTPNEDSDIDLVCLMNRDEMQHLAALSEGYQSFDEYGCGMSLRFGKLNLIALSSERLFELWRESTDYCKSIAPLTKAEAKLIFQQREIAIKEGRAA